MKLKHILFLSFILIACHSSLSYAYNTSISVTQTPKDEITTYTVAKGETVYSIAAAHNTSVQQIYKLNPKAEQGIKAGDKLLLSKAKAVASYSNHLIEAKETLFSVSRLYKISVDDLKNANPGLTESTFSIGKTIRIPMFGGNSSTSNYAGQAASRSNKEYKVQKKETLYSIGKANNVSVEALLDANPSLRTEGLRNGMTIIIPAGEATSKNNLSQTNNTRKSEAPRATKGETVRVGILLPFTDNSGSISKDKLAEYYEGFLLAVKDLKSKGLNAEIYTFDTGSEKNTKRLESLLETNEMKNMHLIIGGVSKQQIDALVKFSKKTGIKYVIPFGSSSEITGTPLLFQMTSSHSSLYTEVTSAFVKRFRNYNIIFVSEDGSNNDKMDFVNDLKKSLSKAGIQSKTITKSSNLGEDLKAAANTTNNIIVPTSSSEATLRRITAVLNLSNDTSFSLFGYPEWQVYNSQVENLHKYDAYIYSIFFLNEQQNAVQNFADDYKQWYNKNLINSFPKWGYLGYDTGLYFLTALKQYGSSFEDNISKINVPTLQSCIYFEKVNEKNGGYVNNGIYFIHYKDNSSLEKIDITD